MFFIKVKASACDLLKNKKMIIIDQLQISDIFKIRISPRYLVSFSYFSFCLKLLNNLFLSLIQVISRKRNL